MNKRLVILGCSSTKFGTEGLLPALCRYDGPAYRVLHSYLRTSRWPNELSVGILSARYGLIGGLTPIELYDQRMNRETAANLREPATATLKEWTKGHSTLSLVLGKDYLSALNLDAIDVPRNGVHVVEGSIGIKLNQLHELLHALPLAPRNPSVEPGSRPLYFLPDWEDMLDAGFDFVRDKFSCTDRAARNEIHCIQAMRPERISDGVLVSLAQHQGTKGILKKFEPTHIDALAPQSIRENYGLRAEQLAFGDCGAFSYVNNSSPTISTEQAAALYQLYGFDLGASVDHIPVSVIEDDGGSKKQLSYSTRAKRVALTKKNAEEFIDLHRRRRYTFLPVGVIQGISTSSYARQLEEYTEMGYRHVALGGLVPRSDHEIVEILHAVAKIRKKLPRSRKEGLWIHLFGVFRPRIQKEVREAGVSSFDSATYFRKAWLRSDQNYLGVDGKWYAAIRVPTTADPRTAKRLEASGIDEQALARLEKQALTALNEYGEKRRSLETTLRAVAKYDFLLSRSSDHGENLLASYERSLKSRIWEKCGCPVCSSIGIHALIFRGYNRNKRRGAHNTLMLYKQLHRKR